MLGIGWTEMLVIGVVALIVIGPQELPALMQKIGRFAGTIRRMGSDFQRELNKTTGLNEVKNLRNAITQPLKSTTDAIRKEFNSTTSGGKVEPSGALKPADPKSESVVDEIHETAGLAKPAEPIKGGPVAAAGDSAKTPEPVKAAASSSVTTPSKPRTTGSSKTASKTARKTPAKKAASKTGAAKTPAAKKTSSAATKAASADKPKTPRKRKPAAKKTS